MSHATDSARVAVIVHDCAQGSVGAVAVRHARELAMKGAKVHLITGKAPYSVPPGVTLNLVHRVSWNWLRRFSHLPKELSFIWAARSVLRELCDAVRIDVVWCHGHTTTAWVAAPIRERNAFRIVMTTHGDIFDRPPGSYAPEIVWLYKQATPRAYRQADTVHALSPYMADRAVRGGAERKAVRIVPNGIDPADIGLSSMEERPVSSFMPRGIARLLYVGALWQVKGPDVLIEALARFHALGVREAHLTLVGEGTEEVDLRRRVDRHGLSDVVHFAGRVDREAMAAMYAAADLLCVPSRSETLPTVALEAMLCGVPVVGSDTGGIPYIVRNEVDGHLAPPDDPAGLADALSLATETPEHLAALGASGRARILERFSWSTISQELFALLGEPSQPPRHVPEAA